MEKRLKRRGWHRAWWAANVVIAAYAHADGPAFDRPGIAFAPSTLPASSFAWEQGLPDFQQDRSNGVTQRVYAASTRLRYGMTDRWEVQLAVPLFERIDTTGSGQAFAAAGAGDLAAALKLSLTSGTGPFSMALLGTVSVPTARRDLGNGSEQYSFGATAGWSLSSSQSVAFYANVDVLNGDATWTLSPNWSFALSESFGGYLEAGYQSGNARGQADNAVAGGGLTWMVRPNVQLDIYGLGGLTKASTDLAAGCGVSVFFP
jgi:hypothetical protein